MGLELASSKRRRDSDDGAQVDETQVESEVPWKVVSGGKKRNAARQRSSSLERDDGRAKEVSGSSRRRGDAVSRQDVQSRHIDRLSQVCKDVMQFCTPDPEEVKQREEALREIETHVRKEHADANLRMFGSSCNGFLQIRSDLDICLTFDHSKDGKDICLEDERRYPLSSSFTNRHDWRGDITLYNNLAQENTRLVKTYGDIDERVRILGYTFKHFAKTCGINDASRGNSILVCCHTSHGLLFAAVQSARHPSPPGAVPGWGAKATKHRRGLGCLVFLKRLIAFHPCGPSSDATTRKAPLTRLEKWTSKSIAIEDPFKLDRDVGKSATKRRTGGQGNGLFGGVKDVRRDELGGFLHV
ncbi:hypothetical protein MRX96_045828 [Rhipicephalus microplus]